MPPQPPQLTPSRHLAVAIVVALGVLLAWELYARDFSAPDATPPRAVQSGDADSATVLPAATGRVAIFGSSQIANVKRDAPNSPQSIPFRLRETLAARGDRRDVVDHSAPGQQAFEMMTLLTSLPERMRPSAVVIGAGMYSMAEMELRPTVRAFLEPDAVRAAILAAAVDSAAAMRMLSLVGEPAGIGDSTVQQRLDARLGARLENASAAMANRRTMFDRLFDQPVRRDLVASVRRRRGMKTARTIGIGPDYAPSLAAIEVIAAHCAAQRIPLYVVVLPFDSTRMPVPQTTETQTRLVADLRRIARMRGFALLDLGQGLPPRRFGDFEDGSPDGLHFDVVGHHIVADSIARLIARPATRNP